jgi:rhodanese-related sulfurtransferase
MSTTAATVIAAPLNARLSDIEPRDARDLHASGACIIVDVREPDEHARERIAGAKSVPLSSLTAASIAALGSKSVVVHCKSGRRSADAAMRCAELTSRGISVANLRGGIDAWKAQGLPTVVDTMRPRMSVMQQTQLVIGIGVLVGTALGTAVHPWLLAIPAMMGAGLIVAGATGTCGLAVVIGKMPWNKGTNCGSSSCAS